MVKELVQVLQKMTEGMEWPSLATISEQGRHIYLQCLERVDEYKGDPETLYSALRLLQTADSRPFAFAGIAYVFVAASSGVIGKHDKTGMALAMQWLEKAQEMEPDVQAINLVEPLIYIHNGRIDDARLVLDYLGGADPFDYQYHTIEIAYWLKRGNEAETIRWIETASQSSVTIPQKLRLRAKLGDVYLKNRKYQEALKVYREALHFDKNNPDLWHKMSIVHYRMDNLEDAAMLNQKVLKVLSDHGQALKLNGLLKEKRGQTGGLKKWFR